MLVLPRRALRLALGFPLHLGSHSLTRRPAHLPQSRLQLFPHGAATVSSAALVQKQQDVFPFVPVTPMLSKCEDQCGGFGMRIIRAALRKHQGRPIGLTTKPDLPLPLYCYRIATATVRRALLLRAVGCRSLI